MYAVLRFLADPTCSDATLCDLGRRLNGIRGFVFDGLDVRDHRFSISISSDEDWGRPLVPHCSVYFGSWSWMLS